MAADGSTFPTEAAQVAAATRAAFPVAGTPELERIALKAELTGELLTAFRETHRSAPDAAEVAKLVDHAVGNGVSLAEIARRAQQEAAAYFRTDGFASEVVSALREQADPQLLLERLTASRDALDAKAEKLDAQAENPPKPLFPGVTREQLAALARRDAQAANAAARALDPAIIALTKRLAPPPVDMVAIAASFGAPARVAA